MSLLSAALLRQLNLYHDLHRLRQNDGERLVETANLCADLQGEARAAAAMEALLAEEAAKQAKQKAKQSKKQAKQRAR